MKEEIAEAFEGIKAAEDPYPALGCFADGAHENSIVLGVHSIDRALQTQYCRSRIRRRWKPHLSCTLVQNPTKPFNPNYFVSFTTSPYFWRAKLFHSVSF